MADFDDEAVRTDTLVLVVRQMNNFWDAVQRYYQVFDPKTPVDAIPETVIIDSMGIRVVHPHPETDSVAHKAYEFGVTFPEGHDETIDPGPWAFVGDDLCRTLLALCDGSAATAMHVVKQLLVAEDKIDTLVRDKQYQDRLASKTDAT